MKFERIVNGKAEVFDSNDRTPEELKRYFEDMENSDKKEFSDAKTTEEKIALIAKKIGLL